MDVEDDFAPDMLQAYLTGDATLMNGLCGDTTKAQVSERRILQKIKKKKRQRTTTV